MRVHRAAGTVATLVLCASVVSCRCNSKRSSQTASTTPVADAAPPDAGPVRATIDRVEMLAGGELLLWRSTQASPGAHSRFALLVRGAAAAAPAPSLDGTWTIVHFPERIAPPAAAARPTDDDASVEVRMGLRKFASGGTVETLRAAGGDLTAKDRVDRSKYELAGAGYRAEFWSQREGRPAHRVETGVVAGDFLAATSDSTYGAAGAASPAAHSLSLGLREAACTAAQVEGEWRSHDLLGGAPAGTWTLGKGRFTATVYRGDTAEDTAGTYRVAAPCRVSLTIDTKPGDRFEAYLRPDRGVGITFLWRKDELVVARVWSRNGDATRPVAGDWRLFAADPIRTGPIAIAPDGVVSGRVEVVGQDRWNDVEGTLTTGAGGVEGALEWVAHRAPPAGPRDAGATK